MDVAGRGELVGRDPDPGPDDVAVGSLSTPVGVIAIAVSRVGLAGVGWRSCEDLARMLGRPTIEEPARVGPALQQLDEYFHGRRTVFDLPLDLRSSVSSRRKVLDTLFETVGYGEFVTYGQLASRSGTGVPARGIGALMGGNPIPIVVPCHRVLAADGLGGYSGGPFGKELDTKRWLLTLEGVEQPTLDWAGQGE